MFFFFKKGDPFFKVQKKRVWKTKSFFVRKKGFKGKKQKNFPRKKKKERDFLCEKCFLKAKEKVFFFFLGGGGGGWGGVGKPQSLD